MLKNFIKILFQNIVVFLAIFGVQASFAGDLDLFSNSDVSNRQIVKDIEKFLVFDDESKKRINFYKKGRAIREIEVEEGSVSKTKDSPASFKIMVVDEKPLAYKAREKERMAYNSAIIGQDEVAMALYKDVLKAEPNNKYAKFSLAVIYQKLGQFNQAKNLYHSLLQESPDNSEEIIGNLLSIIIDETPKQATYLLMRLSQQNPNSAEVFAKLALAHEKVGDYESSIKALQEAIRINPGVVEYQYNLAIIYDKSEQLDKALGVYRQVASDNSDNAAVPISQIEERISYIEGVL